MITPASPDFFSLPAVVYLARYDRDGIVAVDWVGGGERDLPEVSSVALTGLDRDELMGRYHVDDVRQFAEVYPLLRQASHARVRARLKRPGGAWTWVEHRISLRDRCGDVLVVQGLMIDISEQMNAMAELEAAEQRSQVVLGGFAGGIAHHFNNILGAIIGFGDFVVADTRPAQQIHHHARSIVRAARRGKDLVDQILLFARRTSPQCGRFDLADAVAEAVRSGFPGEREVELELQYGLMVEADHAQIGQVVTHLCLNARNALADGTGRMMVRVGRADPDRPYWDGGGGGWVFSGSVSPGMSYASVTVEDTGPGMPASVRERVFDPFFTTGSGGSGTGMGLAVVHGIVMNHAGAIALRSAPGEGTRVEVLLPLAEAADQPAS